MNTNQISFSYFTDSQIHRFRNVIYSALFVFTKPPHDPKHMGQVHGKMQNGYAFDL